jgi:microcystin-dependent protein
MSAQSTDGFQAFPVPVGSVFSYAGGVTLGRLPKEYLVCNGASYLRTDYPELFGVIGTTFGFVDGTHFSVPNMVGVEPKASTTLGVRTTTSTASGTFAPLTLTTSNLPSFNGFPLSANLSGTMDIGSSASSQARFDIDLFVADQNPMTTFPQTSTVNITSNSCPVINYSNGTGTVAPVTFTIANPTSFVVPNTALVFIIKSKSGFNP